MSAHPRTAEEVPAAGHGHTPRRVVAAPSVLVTLARDGDESAFEALVRAHQDRAYAVALRMTGNRQDAQDAVQEAFLRAWQGLPRYRGDAGFGTWLTRIVLNQCAAQRRAVRPTEILPEDAPAQAVPSAENDVIAAQRRDAASQAILALPFDQRAALVLHVFSGYSHAEAGRILGVSENTAKVRVHRARRALTTRLQEWR